MGENAAEGANSKQCLFVSTEVFASTSNNGPNYRDIT